jgi:transcription initiation factor IIE alpha subunit
MLTLADFFTQQKAENPDGIEVLIVDLNGSLEHLAEEFQKNDIIHEYATEPREIKNLLTSLHEDAVTEINKARKLRRKVFLYVSSAAISKAMDEQVNKMLAELNEIGPKANINIANYLNQ